MNIDYLDNLIYAYLNQDYYLSGETIEEVITTCLDCEGTQQANGLIKDCVTFRQVYPDIEAAFDERYRFDFKPARWGITADKFLQMVTTHSTRYLAE